MSHILRRFYLQNVESILEDTKKGTRPTGQVPSQIMYVLFTPQLLPARPQVLL